MAAGLGFKTFTTGEVLTAADTNGYLMQGILVFATEAARNSAITSPQEGQFAFTKDTNSTWYYDGAAWVASGASGDVTGVTAGTGISVTDPTGPVPTVAIDTAVTVDKTTAQTLTNKTLTSPALTTPTISTLTTNGDLLYGTGSGALSRLGIGTTGQVLNVASGVPAWTTPSGGSLDYVLLNSGGTSLSGASTSVSFSAQKSLFIQIIGASSDNANDYAYIKFNSSGTNLTGSSQFQIINTTVSSSFNNSEGQLAIGRISSGANTINSNLLVFGTDKTGFKPIIYSGSPNTTGANSLAVLGLGVFRNTAAITSLQVVSDSTFDAGTVFIYGAA